MTTRTVILDAGHNKATSGKQSPDGSYKEYVFNASIRDKMKYHLERHGITVIYVDSEKTGTSELLEIVEKANKSKGEIFVSLHSNAHTNDWSSANGWEIYCYGKTSKGYELAKAIHEANFPGVDLKDRGIKDGTSLYVIRKTTMPAVLIEHAFHTNKEDLAKLKTDSFVEQLAVCNVKGILNYFEIKWIEESSKTYKVQVGSFKRKENATKLVDELKTKGYKPTIVEV